jgi:hypothetical protein
MGLLIHIVDIEVVRDALKSSMVDWEASYAYSVRAKARSSRELSFFVLALAGFSAMLVLLCTAG